MQNDGTESFYQSLKGLGRFKTYFVYVLLGILTKFSVNPYYEPLRTYLV